MPENRLSVPAIDRIDYPRSWRERDYRREVHVVIGKIDSVFIVKLKTRGLCGDRTNEAARVRPGQACAPRERWEGAPSVSKIQRSSSPDVRISANAETDTPIISELACKRRLGVFEQNARASPV